MGSIFVVLILAISANLQTLNDTVEAGPSVHASQNSLGCDGASIGSVIDTSREDHYCKIALDYIGNQRRVPVLIKISDSQNGEPVQNARVSYRQISHDFILSSLPPAWRKTPGKEAVDLWNDSGLGYIELYVHWSEVEPVQGMFDFAALDQEVMLYQRLYPSAKIIGWIKSVIAPHPNDYWTTAQDPPEWSRYRQITANSTAFEEYKAQVYNYVYHVVDHYRGRIAIWETQELLHLFWLYRLYRNETTPGAGYGTIKLAVGLAETISRAVRDADRSALIVLLGGLPEKAGYRTREKWDTYDFLKASIDEGVECDAVGVIVNPQFGWTPADFYEYYDQLRGLGRKIFVTQMRYPSGQPYAWVWAKTLPWNIFDEETQARWLSYNLVFAYGHEDVIGVGFLQFKDAPSSMTATLRNVPIVVEGWGLLRGDGAPKSAYNTVNALISNFTTTGFRTANSTGELELKGFAGDYTAAVQATDYVAVNVTFHVQEASDNSFVFRLERTTPSTTSTTSTTFNAATSSLQIPNEIPFFGILAVGLASIVIVGIALFSRRRRGIKTR